MSLSREDHALLQQAMHAGMEGVPGLLKMGNEGNKNVKYLLCKEVDILYECRFCRTMFRDPEEFIDHKQNFCKKSHKKVVAEAAEGEESGPSQQYVPIEESLAMQELLQAIDEQGITEFFNTLPIDMRMKMLRAQKAADDAATALVLKEKQDVEDEEDRMIRLDEEARQARLEKERMRRRQLQQATQAKMEPKEEPKKKNKRKTYEPMKIVPVNEEEKDEEKKEEEEKKDEKKGGKKGGKRGGKKGGKKEEKEEEKKVEKKEEKKEEKKVEKKEEKKEEKKVEKKEEKKIDSTESRSARRSRMNEEREERERREKSEEEKEKKKTEEEKDKRDKKEKKKDKREKIEEMPEQSETKETRSSRRSKGDAAEVEKEKTVSKKEMKKPEEIKEEVMEEDMEEAMEVEEEEAPVLPSRQRKRPRWLDEEIYDEQPRRRTPSEQTTPVKSTESKKSPVKHTKKEKESLTEEFVLPMPPLMDDIDSSDEESISNVLYYSPRAEKQVEKAREAATSSSRRKQNLSQLADETDEVMMIDNGSSEGRVRADLNSLPVYLSEEQEIVFFSGLITHAAKPAEGKEEEFECRYCHMKMPNVQAGRRHMVSHVRVIRMRCTLCGAGAFFGVDMRNHLQMRGCPELSKAPADMVKPGIPCMTRDNANELTEIAHHTHPGRSVFTSRMIIGIHSITPFYPDPMIEEKILGPTRVLPASPRKPPASLIEARREERSTDQPSTSSAHAHLNAPRTYDDDIPQLDREVDEKLSI